MGELEELRARVAELEEMTECEICNKSVTTRSAICIDCYNEVSGLLMEARARVSELEAPLTVFVVCQRCEHSWIVKLKAR